MFFSKPTLVVTIAFLMVATGCTNKRRVETVPPVPTADEQPAGEQPPATKPTQPQPGDNGSVVRIGEESSVTMNFPEKAVADYGLNPETLFYTVKFLDAQGSALTTIDRTKMEFDAATNSAQVVMKVKRGSTGKIKLEVEDTSDDEKYVGESNTITVDGDTTAAIEL